MELSDKNIEIPDVYQNQTQIKIPHVYLKQTQINIVFRQIYMCIQSYYFLVYYLSCKCMTFVQ